MMKRMILALVLTFSALHLSAQCPMCKANVESAQKQKETEQKRKAVGTGLNAGILYLLAMPYVAAVGLGVYWYNNQQKKKKIKQA